jgi:dolichyl-phosphate-mannose-protein mannosyltransferase
VRTSARLAVILVGAVTLLAGALRLYGLGHPAEKYFDEVYYASDGCFYAGIPYERCGLEESAERASVHPVLGKVLISLGVDAVGNEPTGWRIGSALAGTVVVALVGWMAFLLFGSALWAGLAALLAATESLLFVQSRIAMLDIYLAMFVVLGFGLLVADRVRQDRRAAAVAARPVDAEPVAVVEGGAATIPEVRRIWRPLRLGAGAAFGAATAVKWSGALALVAAMIVAIAWERSRRARAGVDRPLPRALAEEGFGLYLALVILPLAVYLLSWIPWLADRGLTLLDGSAYSSLARHHGYIIDYHFGLEAFEKNGELAHPYLSRAWSWFPLVRPVVYFWEGDAACCSEIIGMGNPFVFWGSLLFVPYLVLAWWRRRSWQAGAIAVPILVQYLPWLVVARPLFLFYMTPIAPFLVLAAVYSLRDLASVGAPDRRILVPTVGALIVVAVGLFVFFWPVLTGMQLSREAWELRIWFSSWV